jgi:hypothetical protein
MYTLDFKKEYGDITVAGDRGRTLLPYGRMSVHWGGGHCYCPAGCRADVNVTPLLYIPLHCAAQFGLKPSRKMTL